jgi:Putative peptidoglycan binding domain
MMKKNMMKGALLVLFVLLFTGCAMVRAPLEIVESMNEEPSVELVLDRMNTAAAAAQLAQSALNDVPISDSAEWPNRMESFTKKDIQPVMRSLALDGAYAAHGGVVSPIKAHVVEVQELLYELPPDMYSPAGSFYNWGESTMINGMYYRVYNKDKIVKKTKPSLEEMKHAIGSAAKNLFVTKKTGEVSKRNGVLKNWQHIESRDNTYRSVMDAVFDIIPEVDGHDLRAAYDDYMAAQSDYRDAEKKVSALSQQQEKAGKVEGNTSAKDSRAAEEIEKQLKSEQEAAKKLKDVADEKKDIFKDLFGKIKDQDVVLSASQLDTLKNCVAACKGVEGLLADSVSLMTVAIVKAPKAVMNLPNEIKELKVHKKPSASSLWVPLRLARLRCNASNIVGNVKTVVSSLKANLGLVMKIHKQLDGLVKREIAKSPAKGGEKKTYSKNIPRDTRELGRQIQKGLSDLGFNPGPIDGMPGGKTIAAIRKFQRQYGYKVDGKPCGELLVHLREALSQAPSLKERAEL